MVPHAGLEGCIVADGYTFRVILQDIIACCVDPVVLSSGTTSILCVSCVLFICFAELSID